MPTNKAYVITSSIKSIVNSFPLPTAEYLVLISLPDVKPSLESVDEALKRTLLKCREKIFILFFIRGKNDTDMGITLSFYCKERKSSFTYKLPEEILPSLDDPGKSIKFASLISSHLEEHIGTMKLFKMLPKDSFQSITIMNFNENDNVTYGKNLNLSVLGW